MKLRTDAGIVSGYRPARHVKPRGLIGRISLWIYDKLDRRYNAATSSEQGSSAASPSTVQFGLYAQRYENRQIIQDARQMQLDDPRVDRSVSKLAKEATRQGATITIKSDNAALEKKANDIVSDFNVWLTPNLLEGWAEMTVVEGGLFVQAIIDASKKKLLKAKRMPAAGMERMTDDTDEFINPEEAYCQIDTQSNQEVARFPEALMYNVRWRHIDGERYGRSSLASLRRIQKLLEVEENSQVVRRMVRAAMRILWNIGTAEDPSDWAAVEEFKNKNDRVGGEAEIYDPTMAAQDVYSNGLGTATVLEGDRNVHEIADIEYFQNLLTSVLPTPGFLYGLNCESLNRDVMENLRAEWLKEVQDLATAMANVVKWLVELALLLQGVHPSLVTIQVSLSDSSVESPSQVVDRVAKMKDAELISHERAIGKTAEFSGVDDVPAELEQIRKERAERQAMAKSNDDVPDQGKKAA